MTPVISDLKKHYANGLTIDGFLPIDKMIQILESEEPGDLVKISWTVNGVAFFALAGSVDEKDIPYFVPTKPVDQSSIWRLLRRKETELKEIKRILSFHVLPDRSGFLRFESGWDRIDNCLLLDVYGNERMRLTVPWELSAPKNPESAKPPTSFANVSDPYVNPTDGKMGTYGVTAWVQHAGRYYFELDYHTGQFLWGKEIRD